jgi:NodT family efflux transporter outer membrane factor (OMF) lipoprotein
MLRAVMLCLAASLAVGAANPETPRVSVPVAAEFRNVPVGSDQIAIEQWWKGFDDPLLNELIERAGRANLDIRKAASRLAEAQASRKESRSALLPDISGNASASGLRGGFNQGFTRAPSSGTAGSGNLISPFETSVVSAGFNMRWEIDVFGALRKSLSAAGADAIAAAENLRDVQAIVRTEVARTYVELQAAEDQIAIIRANADSEKELLDLVRARADAGLASDLDVERQLSQLASIQATLPELDAQRLQAIHRLGVLLGDNPVALVSQLQQRSRPLQVPETPRAIPSEVLKRRPDVRRADAQIDAAYARVGAARADLYPKFVITGLSGRQATDASGLTLGAGNFFSFGPGVSLPIFNFGRIRSQIAARNAQLEQAMRSYEQDVLAAIEEAENAFVARDRAEQRRRDLEMALAAASRSVELARELYLRGLSDFLTVLDAQRQQFAMEREVAASNAAVLRNTVALYKALGG